MIEINTERCNRCGLCVKICHEHCLILSGNAIHIEYAFCSTCGQCIAVCPVRAVSWGHHVPEPFNNRRLPSSVQLDELLRQRRTHRQFRKDNPERALLEEIVHYGAYAPSHHHDFRVLILDDVRLIKEIDRTVYAFNKKIYRFLFKPRIIRFLLNFLPASQKKEFQKAKPKLEASLAIGRAYESLPPVIIMIVGSKGMALSTESAQYLLYNMDLYARTKGVVCRNLVGNQMFLNRSGAFRRMLKLKKRERIFATMGIGYPSIKFKNKVTGRTMNIQWNDTPATTR